jgi:hypothetical protein
MTGTTGTPAPTTTTTTGKTTTGTTVVPTLTYLIFNYSKIKWRGECHYL